MKRPRRLSTVGRYAFNLRCYAVAGYYFASAIIKIALARILFALARAISPQP
jgi:hypothetical protein